MTAEKKKHKRKFEFKKRGDAAFLDKHSGLARAVAAENGKLVIVNLVPKRKDGSLIEHDGDVVILERPMGMDTKHKPDSELVSLVKDKLGQISKHRGELNKRGKRTDWATLKRQVQSFDCIHNTKIWKAFEIWIGMNFDFQKLNPRKRLAIAGKVLEKMLAKASEQTLMAAAAQRMDGLHGTNVAGDLSKIAGYPELLQTLRDAAGEQAKANKAANIAANTHYEYGMV